MPAPFAVTPNGVGNPSGTASVVFGGGPQRVGKFKFLANGDILLHHIVAVSLDSAVRGAFYEPGSTIGEECTNGAAIAFDATGAARPTDRPRLADLPLLGCAVALAVAGGATGGTTGACSGTCTSTSGCIASASAFATATPSGGGAAAAGADAAVDSAAVGSPTGPLERSSESDGTSTWLNAWFGSMRAFGVGPALLDQPFFNAIFFLSTFFSGLAAVFATAAAAVVAAVATVVAAAAWWSAQGPA